MLNQLSKNLLSRHLPQGIQFSLGDPEYKKQNIQVTVLSVTLKQASKHPCMLPSSRGCWKGEIPQQENKEDITLS